MTSLFMKPFRILLILHNFYIIEQIAALKKLINVFKPSNASFQLKLEQFDLCTSSSTGSTFFRAVVLTISDIPGIEKQCYPPPPKKNHAVLSSVPDLRMFIVIHMLVRQVLENFEKYQK